MFSLNEFKKRNFTVSHVVNGDFKCLNAKALCERVERSLSTFDLREGQLGVMHCTNSIDWLIAYLAAITAKCSLILLPSDYSEAATKEILDIYKPSWMWISNSGYASVDDKQEIGLFKILNDDNLIVYKPQILLATSGSTGSVKFVRLAYESMIANAKAIASYLEISDQDKALVNLPVSYSYGLSIVHSHLLSHASLHLQEISPLNKDFFQLCAQLGISNLNCVPDTAAMLLRMGLEKNLWSNLRFITQAGGNLKTRHKLRMREISIDNAFEFFVMYGQTEAGPRMSWINLSKNNAEQIDSIGKAIPGGSLNVCEKTAELIFTGPNVMLGYAENRNDLNSGDVNCGTLRTGDLGYRNELGNFFITGRSKRIGKISGKRVSLDQIENTLSESYASDVFCTDMENGLAVVGVNIDRTDLKKVFSSNFPNLAISQVRFYEISEAFLLGNGKPDYVRLKEYIQNGH